jgi:hypothetical protein
MNITKTPSDEITFQTTTVQNTEGVSFNVLILHSHQHINYVYTIQTQQDYIIIAFGLGMEQVVHLCKYSDKP